MVHYEIVGSGLIASALTSIRGIQNVVFHAAGVSNSLCTLESEFKRDRDRLAISLRKPGLLVYFSSCEQGAASPYFVHKRAMEALVRERNNYLICRLPIVAGLSPNPHTLLNYLYARISRSEVLDIWKGARRRVIDVADVSVIVEWLIRSGVRNETVNIAPHLSVSLDEIVRVFEEITGKHAIANFLDAGSEYSDSIDTRRMIDAPVYMHGNYLERTLRRYYT